MTDSVIEALDWDSRHFGMAVGRIASSVETPDALAAALTSARALGMQLVYWLSSDAFAPDPRTLSRFGGRRIVGRRRYCRPLSAGDAERPPETACVSLAGTKPDSALRDLALLAGWSSRFRLDTRLPPDRFEVLYQRWIERALSGELADDVLVYRDEEGVLLSLVCYQVRDTTATIGLLATSPAARGRGVGSAMLGAAHQRIRRAGGERAELWTQSENEVACRFFESSGYVADYQGSHYHFLMP